MEGRVERVERIEDGVDDRGIGRSRFDVVARASD